MSFSAFSSFFQKLTFQRSKSQLKNLSFISAFALSAFQHSVFFEIDLV
jgi:hypothetical protein